VKIFDAMGNEVATLLNKKYQAGMFTEKVYVGNILTGVYILEFNDGINRTYEKITITK